MKSISKLRLKIFSYCFIPKRNLLDRDTRVQHISASTVWKKNFHYSRVMWSVCNRYFQQQFLFQRTKRIIRSNIAKRCIHRDNVIARKRAVVEKRRSPNFVPFYTRPKQLVPFYIVRANVVKNPSDVSCHFVRNVLSSGGEGRGESRETKAKIGSRARWSFKASLCRRVETSCIHGCQVEKKGKGGGGRKMDGQVSGSHLGLFMRLQNVVVSL